MTDDTTQRLGGIGIVGSMEIVVGKGIVPVGHSTIVDCVATLTGDDIVGLIEPVLFGITTHKPCIGNAADGWLGGIEARHIRKGGGSLIETTFLKL